MRMSAELFQTIVQSVRSDDSAVENDKRRSQRCSFRGKAQIVPPGASARVWTDVRDLSVEGIGLVHGSPLKCGQEFTLALDTATSDGRGISVGNADPHRRRDGEAIRGSYKLTGGDREPE